MGVSVRLQGSTGSEAPLAEGALKWSLPGMYAHVRGQLTLLGEPLLAHRAPEWFDPCVDPRVDYKVGLTPEILRAHMTRELAVRVLRNFVLFQRAGGGKP